jgi:hypothetical protein
VRGAEAVPISYSQRLALRRIPGQGPRREAPASEQNLAIIRRGGERLTIREPLWDARAGDRGANHDVPDAGVYRRQGGAVERLRFLRQASGDGAGRSGHLDAGDPPGRAGVLSCAAAAAGLHWSSATPWSLQPRGHDRARRTSTAARPGRSRPPAWLNEISGLLVFDDGERGVESIACHLAPPCSPFRSSGAGLAKTPATRPKAVVTNARGSPHGLEPDAALPHDGISAARPQRRAAGFAA